jgi:hypothetical protein
MRLRASPAKKELKEKMRANSRKKPVTGLILHKNLLKISKFTNYRESCYTSECIRNKKPK